VYAVEASDMWEHAEMVVHRNKLENTVEVKHCKVEELCLPEYVDVIISEWMGCFLIYESMLDSVLAARDRLLSQGGIMLPSHACIYLAPINYSQYYEKHITHVGDVCGIDMSSLIPFFREEFTEEAIKTGEIHPNEVLHEAAIIKELDLRRITQDELHKTIARFKFCFDKETTMHGFGTWFTVTFHLPCHLNLSGTTAGAVVGQENGRAPNESTSQHSISLSTSPFAPKTHWGQDVFLLPDYLKVYPGDALEGCIKFEQHSQYKRHQSIEFSFSLRGKEYYRHFLF